jgi:hypothetical protein
MKTPHIESIGRSPLRLGFLLIPLAIAVAGLALLPTARAVDPPPDGGYLFGNTAEGEAALSSLTTGSDNAAIGFNALFYNITGSFNTANGSAALVVNTIGNNNTATGFEALYHNTASYNTAFGATAMFSNTTGTFNTANGFDALYGNTTGQGNTANGDESLYSNTTGGANTATGETALYLNTTGNENTADGVDALFSNTTGSDNTAVGTDALYYNTIGISNTATGEIALQNNTTGNTNTAVGHNALLANTTGSSNIAVGDSAGINLTTGSNNIDIGNKGIAGESKAIRIGKKGTQTTTVIAGINGTTVAGGIGVLIDSNGRLGTTTSSARFKEAIKPMDKASEAIHALKPVTFRYKQELDPKGIPQFGLVAEDVAKVDPDLVARDEEGKPYTVRYEAVNAMLLNEFLKEHHKVQDLKAALAQQQKQIEALTAGLERVSAQIELRKPAPQMANNQ